MSITTNINPPIDRDDLKALIGQYKYGRYYEDPTLPLEGSRRLVLDRVQEYLSHGEAQCVVALSSSGEIVGILLFKLSQWDTEHFGYPVAVIDSMVTKEFDYDHQLEIVSALLEHFHGWCRAADVCFASARVPALDLSVVHGFEQWGFRYIESWIYNKYGLNKLDELEREPYSLRLARPDDMAVMIDYSKGAFVTHRFHADPRVALTKADSLYEKWISTAFADPHQQILVLDIENKPAAFMIYYKSDLRCYFGLQFAMWRMAVLNPTRRGKGLGTDFFTALMYYHRRDGLDVVDSGLSMRNLASLNLHNKLGFKVVAMVVTFHKWLK